MKGYTKLEIMNEEKDVFKLVRAKELGDVICKMHQE